MNTEYLQFPKENEINSISDMELQIFADIFLEFF